MDAARWRELEEAFEAASALTGAERDRWLAVREAEDPALAHELRSLLAADASAGVLDALAPRMSSVRAVLGGDGAEDELPLPPRIGPWVVAGEIGRGGMGVVCRAHDPRLGRDVAIKIFPRTAGDAAERRVLAEARAASALDHPHICTIHDVGVLEDGRPYMVMAFYPGGTLADRLAGGALPPRTAATIALQVAEALAVAHQAGMVHRDVKPHNIAFAERDVAKLLDFGVAQLRDQDEARASAGTVAYMSPEQVRRERVDGRADVWALGVVLFEMLCARRPFTGPDRRAVLASIERDDAPDVRTLHPEVPEAIAAVVARALRKSPDERWPDAAGMAAALRDAVGDRRPVSATRRGRRALAGAALVVAALVAGAGAWGVWGRRASAVAPAAAPEPELLARARRGYHAATAEGLEEAITLLHMLLATDSTNGAAHALLARSYVVSTFEGRARAGKAFWLDSAVAEATRAKALSPRLPEGWAALGIAYAALGRHRDALAEFHRAIELDPRHASAMMDLARSYSVLGHNEEAVLWTERALVADSSLVGGHARAAARYRVFDLFERSRHHIDRGLEVTPTDKYLRWDSILLELAIGDTAQARQELAEYLPLIPPTDHARLRASFEFLRGDARAARPFVDQAIGTVFSGVDRRAYGITFVLTGDRARGDSILRRELRWLREEASSGRQIAGAPYLGMAHIFAALGERDSAVAALARWDSAGRMVSWSTTLRQPGWDAVRDDPRFREIVARSEARFQRSRQRMLAQLEKEFGAAH